MTLEQEPRWTLVHDRYQIVDQYCGLFRTAMSRSDAFRIAYEHYESHTPDAIVEVFDTMAQHGKPQLWDYQGNLVSLRPTVYLEANEPS